MKYYVSRQLYYYSGEKMVEIAIGGRDYSGADELAGHYGGEGEYGDPREAVEAAIGLWERWVEEDPEVQIGVGNTHGMGLELEGSPVEEIRKWAEEEYERLPKCDRCGDVIEEEWKLWEYDMVFCSENCAENAWWELEGSEEEDEDV